MISTDQTILFQLDYVNFAWGYQHYGYMIDNKGRVLTYNNPEKWNFPNDNFILTETQMEENISMCRISEKQIPVGEIKKYAAFIESISASKVSALRNTGNDAGSLQYNCYKYNESNLIYKGFLIKTEGDFTAENLNFHTRKVVTWMKDINENLPE
ncbi:MAG TPA: hypothetical protein VHO46_08245 [Bacteroidales bacterium]|nr:hypothetical protein [Bacteroidales bacterium]